MPPTLFLLERMGVLIYFIDNFVCNVYNFVYTYIFFKNTIKG